jgi:hypothetical protein
VDSVAQDARNMGINNWKKAAQDRERWRELLAEAKTRQGCSATDDESSKTENVQTAEVFHRHRWVV